MPALACAQVDLLKAWAGTTDTVVALRSMQLTRDRITGTEVGAPPEEDEEKPEAALHKRRRYLKGQHPKCGESAT